VGADQINRRAGDRYSRGDGQPAERMAAVDQDKDEAPIATSGGSG